MLNGTDPNQEYSKPSGLDNLKLFLSRFSLKKILIASFILVLTVVIGIGVMIFLKNKNNSLPSSNQLSLSELKKQLTPQIRSCIVQKLGKNEAKRLLEKAKETKEIPPEALQTIHSCLPSNPTDKVFLTQTTGGDSTGGVTITTTTSMALGSFVRPQDIKSYCSNLQNYDSKYSWITISWQAVEPSKGQFRLSQIDQWVNGLNSCGQELAAHVLSNARWAVKPVPEDIRKNQKHEPAMPAQNQQDYYNFMFNLVQHYKGKIARYAIENEANATQNWGATPEEYIQQLQTAYKAVHAADPNALVEDSGFASTFYGVQVAYDIYQSGQQQKAIDFLNEFLAHYGEGQASSTQLINALQAGQTPPGLPFFNLLMKNSQYYDRLQVHYYGPWQYMTTVTDFIHRKLAVNKTLDFLEMGYAWKGAPENGYDSQVHARDLVKLITTAFGEGADRIIQFQFTDYAVSIGHLGLFDKSGNPRPAAISYKITSEKLTGAVSAKRLSLGANIWGYEFTKAGKSVFVVWSLAKTKVSLPLKGNLTVTDVLGNIKNVDADELFVDTSPVFIEL